MLSLHRMPVPEWLLRLSQREWRGNAMGYLAHHSHSFRYAARFLPAPHDARVADIYAFCRFTDDLVDHADTQDAQVLNDRLNAWKTLAQQAYAGESTGIPFLDLPLLEMGRRGLPFRYAGELIEGVRMDLTRHRYATLGELEVYTYRVASVVGLWLTEMVGQHHPEVLRHAADLGHAMQLTNILRDVGEDFRSGRLYLPLSRLAAHGLSPASLIASMGDPESLPEAWPELMEEMMSVAEARYKSALKGIPHLPVFFQKPVLTATLVYRDIHTALRAIGYDNLRQRAHTTKWRKVMLGLRSQVQLPFMRRALAKRTGRGPNSHRNPVPSLVAG